MVGESLRKLANDRADCQDRKVILGVRRMDQKVKSLPNLDLTELEKRLQTPDVLQAIERFWRLNGLLACRLSKPAGAVTRDEAVKDFVRKVGGVPDSVQFCGEVPRPEIGDKYGVYHADMGYHAREAWLVAATKFGTCWYVGFSPREGGALAGVFP